MPKNQIQTLAKMRGGLPPGFRWNVLSLDLAHRESEKCLTDGEQKHIADLVRQLARERDPTHSDACDVRSVEGFHELRDTGGPLGGKNARLFFGLDKKKKAIVVLGVILKQNNGKTPPGDRVRMKRRWRLYCEGEFT